MRKNEKKWFEKNAHFIVTHTECEAEDVIVDDGISCVGKETLTASAA